MTGTQKKQSAENNRTIPISGDFPSRKTLAAQGKELRDLCPRTSHAGWTPPTDRPDPLALIEESNRGRVRELIPIRYGRMLQSPFTFYRGTAAIMAADLARTPTTGVHVQSCGDCHLLNFGGFATPERRLVFDINDFDETLPAPWEWDVKRLAASFVIAGRSNRFHEADARAAALACVRSYRERMAECAKMRMLDVWYTRIDSKNVLAMIQEDEVRRRIRMRTRKARQRDEFPRLVDVAGGKPVIRNKPPLIYHLPEASGAEFAAQIEKSLAAYRASLPAYRRVLLDRYRLQDIAAKVVGVGSVGTRCAIVLMMAGADDPLFLQVKEARRSVLEPYVGKSSFANNGERIVTGQRIMQSASDLFLGWTAGNAGRHFYVRQLRDMKLKPLVELFTPPTLLQYAESCGRALAHAHARSGQPALISGYLGKGRRFDVAVAEFAVAYADQSERDYQALLEAAQSGRIEVSRDG
jgi:uncharacterized protein (DUF2252 family)